MSIVKPIIIGLIGGLTIGLIWNLQDMNYYLGTTVGLVVVATVSAIVWKAIK